MATHRQNRTNAQQVHPNGVRQRMDTFFADRCRRQANAARQSQQTHRSSFTGALNAAAMGRHDLCRRSHPCPLINTNVFRDQCVTAPHIDQQRAASAPLARGPSAAGHPREFDGSRRTGYSVWMARPSSVRRIEEARSQRHWDEPSPDRSASIRRSAVRPKVKHDYGEHSQFRAMLMGICSYARVN